MKKLLTLLMTIGCLSGYSQLLPSNQPEQNPCAALEICGTFYTPYSYQGIGTTSDLTNTPCGTALSPCGEDNVVWFKLNVTTSGVMVFRIVPTVIADDYDWALLNGSGKACSSIGYSDVIRCNFNTNAPIMMGGQTGLDLTSTLLHVQGGETGMNFCRYVDVLEGEVYYLMINNFGASGGPTAGFNLDFAGSTATFNTPPAPKLQSVLTSACNIQNSVRIKLDRLIKCNSIAANGSDFTIAPFGTITAAAGVDCGGSGSGYTDEIIISFSGNLPPAYYTLSAATGTDGNTLLNLCDVPLVLPDRLNFTVYKLSDTVEMELCEGQLPYSWNGITITSGGWAASYTSDNVIGCDSVTRLFVTLVDTINTTTHLTLCTNQMPYTWNGIVVTTAGSPAAAASFVTTGGCDSVSSLFLTVTPPKRVTSTLQICSYDLPQTWNGITIPAGAVSNPTYDTFHTVTATGCDSFTTLNLIVHQISPSISTTDTHACGSLTYKGVTYTTNAVLTDTFFASSGCDSAYVTFNVFVHYNIPMYEIVDWEACDSTIFRGRTYHNDTLIVDSFKSVYGCDSFLTYNYLKIQHFDLNLDANFETIVNGEALTLSTSGNLTYEVLSWTPNHLFPNQHLFGQYIKPSETHMYTVTAQSEYGCRDTAQVLVEVVPLVPDMMMPSAFSPNGDGLNDDFRPVFFHETGYRINYFRIFNRWGNLVYALENSRVQGWNGMNDQTGEHADAGVYFYTIEVEFVNGQKVSKKGDVTLLR